MLLRNRQFGKEQTSKSNHKQRKKSVICRTFFTKYWPKIKIQCGSQNFEPFIFKQETALTNPYIMIRKRV